MKWMIPGALIESARAMSQPLLGRYFIGYHEVIANSLQKVIVLLDNEKTSSVYHSALFHSAYLQAAIVF